MIEPISEVQSRTCADGINSLYNSCSLTAPFAFVPEAHDRANIRINIRRVENIVGVAKFSQLGILLAAGRRTVYSHEDASSLSKLLRRLVVSPIACLGGERTRALGTYDEVGRIFVRLGC
jgi:hypothetical protein